MLLSRILTPVWTALIALALAASISAQAPQGEKGKGKGGGQQQAQSIQQLKPGLYLVMGAGGNTSVRVTNEGLIVGDTKNLGEPFFNALMEQIKTVSQQPVKFAVITHHHQDHSGNIALFNAAGAQTVAHENLKKNVETYAPAQGKVAPPSVTYSRDYTIRMGGTEARVYHFEPAHTSGDSILHYPDLRVVQCGDVVVGGAPNVDFPFGGSAVNWVKTLDAIDKLDWDTLIPGHSAPGGSPTMTRADFAAYKQKWNTLVSRFIDEVKKGTPKDQLLAAIKTDDIGWNVNTQQWQQAARLDPLYAELRAAAR
jgi:glyoxylase-like metal-dependent hydrolase (beta-lactamase superfamily II)